MDGASENIQLTAIDDALRKYLLSTVTSPTLLNICTSHIQGAGLGVITQDAIPAAGEAFRVNAPFIDGLSDPENTCDNCYSHTDTKFDTAGHYTSQLLHLMDCKRCKSVKYCSKQCQTIAWSTHHKTECKDLMKTSELERRDSGTGPQTRAIKRAFARLLKKYGRGDLKVEEQKAVNNLESHHEHYTKDPTFDKFHEVKLAGISDSSTSLSADEGHEIYCKLMTNAISIRQPNSEQSLGVVLDLFCSMINHSCDPNVFFFFEGSQLRCRTIRPIAAGEELFISYTDQTYDAGSRGKELLDGYSFKCTCNRCREELSNVDEGDIVVIETKLKMQEQLLQSHREIAMRAMKSASIERHIRSIWTVSDPSLRRKLGLENGWPEDVQPMPDTRFYLARLTQSVDTEYSLRTLLRLCFVTFPKMHGGAHGKEWIMAFSLLVFTLRIFIKERSGKYGDWSLVYIVWLKEMAENAKECYGPDTAFVKANQELFLKETAVLSAEQARSFALVLQYRSDQKDIFTWAGISNVGGVKIPNTGLAIH